MASARADAEARTPTNVAAEYLIGDLPVFALGRRFNSYDRQNVRILFERKARLNQPNTIDAR